MGVADVAYAGHDDEHAFQLTEYGVEGQAGASAWVQAEEGAEGLGEHGEGDVEFVDRPRSAAGRS